LFLCRNFEGTVKEQITTKAAKGLPKGQGVDRKDSTPFQASPHIMRASTKNEPNAHPHDPGANNFRTQWEADSPHVPTTHNT
jgi:hypothetical protein